TVAGIANLTRMGQRVLTNSVVVQHNLDHLEALAELLVRLRVAQYQLALVHPLGAAASGFAEVVPRMEQVAERLRAACRPGLRAGIGVMVEAVPFCFLHGLETLAAELAIPFTRI